MPAYLDDYGIEEAAFRTLVEEQAAVMLAASERKGLGAEGTAAVCVTHGMFLGLEIARRMAGGVL